MATRKPLVLINGVLSEMQTGDLIDPSLYVAGEGGAMSTFNATLDFGRGGMTATATITDPTMTTTKIIQAFYTNALDEVAVLAMRVNERSRTDGVGFEIIGVAPNGAFGQYDVRIITQGA